MTECLMCTESFQPKKEELICWKCQTRYPEQARAYIEYRKIMDGPRPVRPPKEPLTVHPGEGRDAKAIKAFLGQTYMDALLAIGIANVNKSLVGRLKERLIIQGIQARAAVAYAVAKHWRETRSTGYLTPIFPADMVSIQFGNFQDGSVRSLAQLRPDLPKSLVIIELSNFMGTSKNNMAGIMHSLLSSVPDKAVWIVTTQSLEAWVGTNKSLGDVPEFFKYLQTWKQVDLEFTGSPEIQSGSQKRLDSVDLGFTGSQKRLDSDFQSNEEMERIREFQDFTHKLLSGRKVDS